jgi:hypothetical protein
MFRTIALDARGRAHICHARGAGPEDPRDEAAFRAHVTKE